MVAGEKEASRRGPTRTVLVFDTSGGPSTALRRALSPRHRVRVYASAAEALASWRQEGADVVVLALPLDDEACGVDVLRSLREDAYVPIVIVGSDDSLPDPPAAYGMGATFCVPGPDARHHELLHAVGLPPADDSGPALSLSDLRFQALSPQSGTPLAITARVRAPGSPQSVSNRVERTLLYRLRLFRADRCERVATIEGAAPFDEQSHIGDGERVAELAEVWDRRDPNGNLLPLDTPLLGVVDVIGMDCEAEDECRALIDPTPPDFDEVGGSPFVDEAFAGTGSRRDRRIGSSVGVGRLVGIRTAMSQDIVVPFDDLVISKYGFSGAESAIGVRSRTRDVRACSRAIPVEPRRASPTRGCGASAARDTSTHHESRQDRSGRNRPTAIRCMAPGG